MKKILITLIMFVTLFATTASASSQEMRVGFVGTKPFVMQTKNGFTGLSVDLWEEVATENSILFTSKRYSTVEIALENLKEGNVDVIVGPISITSERYASVYFTQPYYKAGLSIMAPSNQSTFFDQMKNIGASALLIIFSKTFLVGLLVLSFVVFIFGIAVWLSERSHNESDFPKPFLSGLSAASYYVWVVMTTTGLGDLKTQTVAGRITTCILMLFSYISLPLLTGFAAAFTAISVTDDVTISSIEQIANKNVAVLDGSSAIPFVKNTSARIVRVKNVEDGIDLVKEGKASALIYDKPVLSYMVHNGKADGMSVSIATYNVQGYGFAVTDFNLQHQLSLSILKITESSRMVDIVQKWLGK